MILVVGASGKTGSLVVGALLDRGIEVRAFARGAATIAPRPNQECVAGDVLDVDAVRIAMHGVLGVVALFGPNKLSPTNLCSQGTLNILSAMRSENVARVVCVTGAIIGHPHDKLGMVYKLIESHVPQDALEDRREQERLLTSSDLDWTIVRPTRLTNGAPATHLRTDSNFVVGALAHVARVDVANFVVAALYDAQTLRRAYTLAV